MPKIKTFDANGFWNNSYAHQRAKLLSFAKVPEDQIKILINKKYLELPSPLRYEIETSGVSKNDLV